MRMKKWLTAAAIMAVSASLAIAMPHGGEGGHHGEKGGYGEKLAQKLNLTDTQKQQLSNDTAKLQSLKPAVDSQMAQLKQLRDAQDAKILSILTPDQQTQFKAIQAERAAKWQKRSQQ